MLTAGSSGGPAHTHTHTHTHTHRERVGEKYSHAYTQQHYHCIDRPCISKQKVSLNQTIYMYIHTCSRAVHTHARTLQNDAVLLPPEGRREGREVLALHVGRELLWDLSQRFLSLMGGAGGLSLVNTNTLSV